MVFYLSNYSNGLALRKVYILMLFDKRIKKRSRMDQSETELIISVSNLASVLCLYFVYIHQRFMVPHRTVLTVSKIDFKPL